MPVVALAAGALFAVSAQTARGTDLRSPQSADLADTVQAAVGTDARLTDELAALQAQVNALTAAAGVHNARVAATQQQLQGFSVPFGQTALTGPGLVVTLDDAPAGAATDPTQPVTDLDQLVIHQSDLQAVVNALWAGGSQAVAVAGQRLVPTSAVRCVGNTLLLNGRVYSPPFRVAAIGPSSTMRAALDRSDGVALLKQAARYYGVGYSVSGGAAVSVPAYDGPTVLNYARPE